MYTMSFNGAYAFLRLTEGILVSFRAMLVILIYRTQVGIWLLLKCPAMHCHPYFYVAFLSPQSTVLNHRPRPHTHTPPTCAHLHACIPTFHCHDVNCHPVLNHSPNPTPTPALTHTHTPIRWRHNERDSVSNRQPHDCVLNRLFRRRSKKTSKLRVTGLCVRNSPGTGGFPAQMASYAENVSIWWRHHSTRSYTRPCPPLPSIVVI